jgi:hypothetical protein
MDTMQRFSEAYIRHARLGGALYCIVPAVIWFVVFYFLIPFRSVYLLRLGISVVLGGYVAAWLPAYGVKMWLIKHRSPAGPATAVDGAVIGAAVGGSIQVIPALTNFIATNHPDEIKGTVIVIWLSALAIGAVIGSSTSAILGRSVSRSVDGASG